MTEVWTQWEGQLVNGVYPLRRFLNASDHSAVFLTESATEGFLNAAIKLVTADPAANEVQLWHWKTATTFSHPHLIRLLDSGQCELGGRPLLFVVMELAEETLSQILPYRALEPGEVRELLVPTLDALAFLHRENWVQGQLKPSNFLVVNDQLKLATDTIRPVGLSRANALHPSAYDPPEADAGELSSAADIWALGVTMVEALTQYPPSWPNGRSEPPTLPANLPSSFVDTVQRCLSPNPSDRPTTGELRILTDPAATAPGIPDSGPTPSPAPAARQETVAPAPRPEPVMRATPHALSMQPKESAGNRAPVTIVAIVVVFVMAWGGLHLFRGHPQAQPPAEIVPQSSSPQRSEQAMPGAPAGALPSGQTPRALKESGAGEAPRAVKQLGAAQVPPAVKQPGAAEAARTAERIRAAEAPAHPKTSAPLSAEASPAVIHEEIPKVPQSARDTIHGHIKVAVRVTVDGSGNVVRDRFERPGPSNYFNRLASQAARRWKFTSAGNQGTRDWLLRFEFGREGTTVHADRPRS